MNNSINIHSCYTHEKHCNTVLYSGTPMLYTQYTYIIHACITMIYTVLYIRSCVKCLITQVLHYSSITGVCTSVNQSKTWLYTCYTLV